MATLFSVDFENNNLIDPTDGFGAILVRGGVLEVSATAALTGSYGLAVTPIVGYICQGMRATGTRTTRLRQAFQFDPNSLTLSAGTYLYIAASAFSNDVSHTIAYTNNGGVYKIMAGAIKDDNVKSWTSMYEITDAPHLIEVDWQASSAAGANDGFISLWIDGALQQTVANVDNDTKRAGYPAIGCMQAPAGFSGTYYLDHWRVNTDGVEIGA